MSNAYTPWEKFWEGAACRAGGVDPELFYDPDDSTLKRSELIRRENQAKRICSQCPIKSRCMNYAITHSERGIWGGLSEKERVQRQKVAKQFLTPQDRSKLYL